MKTVLALLLFMAGVGSFNAAGAQDYPNKAIRLMVPFSPGGGTDLQARTISQELNEAWGQPVIVDHRPGATGAVASNIVLQSPADGYTIFIVTSSTHAISPNLFRDPPYNPVKDFDAVTQTATAPEIICSHPSVPVRSVQQLIDLAKAQPGKLNYASPGTGSIGHMTAELFKHLTGTQIVGVPYKGSGAAVRELVGGQVEVMFSAPGAVISYVRAGRLRALGVLAAERTPVLKEVPTLAELGYPQIDASNWYGFLVRSGTPRPIINKLAKEIARIVEQPKVRALLLRQGYTVKTSSPEAFAAHMRKEFEKWGKVVRDTGMGLK
ncbi:MAG: tripartite tricarboxylate transporter substrate binding protein [Betaproteobacteria bacterium]|nr:tripartite tricarboxylate transporter substrate binding protein [Betaproteobacteria bacterium]